MPDKSENPFFSIESAQEYVALLTVAIRDAKHSVEIDSPARNEREAARRAEAFQLVTYKLGRLEQHLESSHRILNDLRTLRRLLLHERSEIGVKEPAESTTV